MVQEKTSWSFSSGGSETKRYQGIVLLYCLVMGGEGGGTRGLRGGGCLYWARDLKGRNPWGGKGRKMGGDMN